MGRKYNGMVNGYGSDCARDFGNSCPGVCILANRHRANSNNWAPTMFVQKLTLRIFILFAIVLFGSTTASANDAPKTPNKALDVVLVMDSSGSMKHSDPQELRKPAAKLFISLLGADDRASVVSFSDQGYPVAFLSPVKGKSIQEKLFASVDKISTRGVYTNLKGALETALKVLNRNPKPDRKKVIILMSDGKMDVGDKQKAIQHTNSILQELLPRLKAENIEVQTLAFTEQSDQDLLKKIATNTDGKFQLALSDKDLHGVYTDMFEHNKQPDMIPFEGELFSIDKSIKEVTIVGSKDNESVTLSLISPSKKVYMAKDAQSHIKWSESSLFDLITITKPESGEWKIKASSGKNKAYVITDLNLNTNLEPKEPAIGEGVMITSWLENQGKIIKQQDFRAPLAIKLQVNTPEGEAHLLDMEPEATEAGQAETGVFASYIALPTAGRHELKIKTKTATFSREQTVYLNVLGPQVQKPQVAPIVPPIPSVNNTQSEITEGSHHKAPTDSNKQTTQQHEDLNGKPTEHTPATTAKAPSENPIPSKHKTDQKPKVKSKENDSDDKATHKDKKLTDQPKAEKSNKDNDSKKSSGMATAVYLFIAINLLLLIIGAIIFVIIRKKNKKSSESDEGSDAAEAEEIKEAA